ncbi:hypothetical protein MHBO_003594 [Bonamia ostreae]|uniref:Uncharacterized protein n=1 Tax=Bonamia ostreae TaxID=126728 RepID=A0ABV2ARJ5_9EUKA
MSSPDSKDLSNLLRLDPMWLDEDLWKKYSDFYMKVKQKYAEKTDSIIKEKKLTCAKCDGVLKIDEIYFCPSHLRNHYEDIMCLGCKNEQLKRSQKKVLAKEMECVECD